MNIIKYIIYSVLILVNIVYTLDEKIAYPKFIIDIYSDNFYRFLLYLLIFITL